jgi:hypothetical protein
VNWRIKRNGYFNVWKEEDYFKGTILWVIEISEQSVVLMARQEQ